jgi:hypothetical protein
VTQSSSPPLLVTAPQPLLSCSSASLSLDLLLALLDSRLRLAVVSARSFVAFVHRVSFGDRRRWIYGYVPAMAVSYALRS